MSIVPFQSDDRPTGDALSLPAVNDGASRARMVKPEFKSSFTENIFRHKYALTQA